MPIVAFARLAVVLMWLLLALDPLRPLRLRDAATIRSAARIAGIPAAPAHRRAIRHHALIAYLAGLVMAAAVSGMSTRVYNSTMIYDVLLVVVLGGIGLSGGRGGVRNVLVGTLLVGVLLERHDHPGHSPTPSRT